MGSRGCRISSLEVNGQICPKLRYGRKGDRKELEMALSLTGLREGI